MLVDSHCHLDFNDFEDDFEDMLQRAKEQGVTAMLNAGNNVGELDKQLKISEKYPFIYTAAGVHPHNAAEYPDIKAEDFVRYSKHKKVVAIGECGLDYYYDYSPKDMQIRVLKEQVKAAQETGLPLIIHNRESDEDMMSVLDEAYKQKPFCGVIHCFSSSRELAEFALSIGFYISASGMITFLTPVRYAASAFSFSPPMGSTLPKRVISPVIAMSPRTGLPVNAERIAVAIVMPALGPSLGVAPSGT